MKKKIIITVVVSILVVAAALIATSKAFLFNDKLGQVNYWTVRAYTGDRITLNMHVKVDGKPAEVTNKKLDFCLSNHDGCTVLKDRANMYDTFEYPILIKNGGKDIPLNITVNHWNWWEIVESDLYIDIDSKAEEYTVNEEYEYTAESQSVPVVYYIAKEKEPTETVSGIESIDIYAGCKG